MEDADPAKVEEEKNRIALFGDATDINIWVTCIERQTGRIWDTDGGVHPYDFEYAQIEPGTKDLAERVMLEMQKLLLGKRGSMQFIYDACVRLQEDFMESVKREQHITGVGLKPWSVKR